MPSHGRTTRDYRFFYPTLPLTDTQTLSDTPVTLDKTESHHARHVLRLSAGDAVTLFDGRGTLASAVIDQYTGSRAVCVIRDIQHQPPITPSLTLASAVPKGPRADAMVDQLSQLGVDRFVPLICEHSVAIPKPGKIEKFSRAAVESAKQCGRAWLMRVDEPVTVDALLNEPGHDLKLIAAPNHTPLADLTAKLSQSDNTLVMVGPEGGWSENELGAATNAGCLSWPIAPHVLRIETAAVTAAAILRYTTLA